MRKQSIVVDPPGTIVVLVHIRIARGRGGWPMGGGIGRAIASSAAGARLTRKLPVPKRGTFEKRLKDGNGGPSRRDVGNGGCA